MVSFTLADGSVDTRRDNDFEIAVRRKDLRAQQEKGGVLFIDDAHQLDPAGEKPARQVLYRLADEMDMRGGGLAVVMAGYEKALYEQVLLGYPNPSPDPNPNPDPIPNPNPNPDPSPHPHPHPHPNPNPNPNPVRAGARLQLRRALQPLPPAHGAARL